MVNASTARRCDGDNYREEELARSEAKTIDVARRR